MGNQEVYESEPERGRDYFYPGKADYEAVSADADMEDLLQKAMNQNFVPVVDDQKKFIGIITRKSIIEYCYEKIKKLDEPY